MRHYNNRAIHVSVSHIFERYEKNLLDGMYRLMCFCMLGFYHRLDISKGN